MRFLPVFCIGSCMALVHASVQAQPVVAQTNPATITRQVMVDVFYRAGNAEDEAWSVAADKLADQVPGLRVIKRDVASDKDMAEHLKRINAASKLPVDTVPIIYGLSRAIHAYKDDADLKAQLEKILVIEMFTQPNCPHCGMAEQYWQKTLPQYPALRLIKRDVVADSQAKADLNKLYRQRGTSSQTVPVFHLANQLIIGFDTSQQSGEKIDEILKKWTAEVRVKSTANIK